MHLCVRWYGLGTLNLDEYWIWNTSIIEAIISDEISLAFRDLELSGKDLIAQMDVLPTTTTCEHIH